MRCSAEPMMILVPVDRVDEERQILGRIARVSASSI